MVEGINGMNTAKVDVDAWGSKPNGNDCYWNIAKNQLGEGANAQEIQALTQRLEAKNSQIREQEGKSQVLQAENDQVFLTFDVAQDEMQTAITTAQTNFDSVSGELTSMSSELTSLTGNVTSALGAYNDALAALQSAQAQAGAQPADGQDGAAQTVDTSSYEAAVAQAKADYDAAVQKQQELQAQITAKQQEASECQQNIANLSNEYQQLALEFAEEQGQIEAAKADIDAYIATLNAEVQETYTSLQQAQQKAEENAAAANVQEAMVAADKQNSSYEKINKVVDSETGLPKEGKENKLTKRINNALGIKETEADTKVDEAAETGEKEEAAALDSAKEPEMTEAEKEAAAKLEYEYEEVMAEGVKAVYDIGLNNKGMSKLREYAEMQEDGTLVISNGFILERPIDDEGDKAVIKDSQIVYDPVKGYTTLTENYAGDEDHQGFVRTVEYDPSEHMVSEEQTNADGSGHQSVTVTAEDGTKVQSKRLDYDASEHPTRYSQYSLGEDGPINIEETYHLDESGNRVGVSSIVYTDDKDKPIQTTEVETDSLGRTVTQVTTHYSEDGSPTVEGFRYTYADDNDTVGQATPMENPEQTPPSENNESQNAPVLDEQFLSAIGMPGGNIAVTGNGQYEIELNGTVITATMDTSGSVSYTDAQGNQYTLEPPKRP